MVASSRLNTRDAANAPRIARALAGVLILASLFPLYALATYLRTRETPLDSRVIVVEEQDYIGAVLAGALLVALAGALVLRLAPRGRGRGRPLAFGIAGAALLILVQWVALTTGGWRPARVEPGRTAIVVPTYPSNGAIPGGAGPVEYNGREVDRLLGRPLPPELRTPTGPELAKPSNTWTQVRSGSPNPGGDGETGTGPVGGSSL